MYSKPMTVQADQLMLRDVVTNDGELGTVFRLDATDGGVTVWFHNGRMEEHEFFVVESHRLSIVRTVRES